MAHTIHESFGSIAEADFSTYLAGLLEAHETQSEKKQALTYVQQVLASDKDAMDDEQTAMYKRRALHLKQQKEANGILAKHNFDFAKTPTLFQDQSRSDAEIAALLTLNDVDVRIGTKTLTAAIALSGNRVSLVGTGATGKAADGTLACTCKINGAITISGDDVIIKGVHFVCSANTSITVAQTSNNITIEDCIFENTSTYSDSSAYGGSRFWVGAQNTGSITIKNCQIGVGTNSYGSWLLADLNTASSAATGKLDKIVVDGCRFTNCAGSFAARGIATDPIDSCEYTNNVVNYGSGAYAQDSLFWATFEVNNCVSVKCTGNTVTGAARSSDPTIARHFFQAWSRSPHAWCLTFEKNTISGFTMALGCPGSDTFYFPSGRNPLYKIGSEAGAITDCTYGAVTVYPWLTGSEDQENPDEMPSLTTTFADGLANFAGP